MRQGGSLASEGGSQCRYERYIPRRAQCTWSMRYLRTRCTRGEWCTQEIRTHARRRDRHSVRRTSRRWHVRALPSRAGTPTACTERTGSMRRVRKSCRPARGTHPPLHTYRIPILAECTLRRPLPGIRRRCIDLFCSWHTAAIGTRCSQRPRCKKSRPCVCT